MRGCCSWSATMSRRARKFLNGKQGPSSSEATRDSKAPPAEWAVTNSAGGALLSRVASLELGPCFPLRNFRALRDIVADHEQQPRIFHGACEIPVSPNRVGHLVVTLRNVLVDPLAGVALRLADIVSAG